MFYSLTVIILIVISIGTSIKTLFYKKITQEEALVLSFLFVIIFIYILGLANLLKYYRYIYVFGAMSFTYNCYNLYKKKIFLKDIFTFPILIFLVIMYFFVFVLKNCGYVIYDEYMFWGTNLKYMFNCNLLWCDKSFELVHQTYPPLVAVNEWFFLKVQNVYREDITILAMTFWDCICLLPIISENKTDVKNFFRALFKCLIFFLIVFILNGNFQYILVDTILRINVFNGNVYCL